MRIVVKANDEILEICKSFGVKNYSRLTKKRITDKNGHSRFVWVKNEEDSYYFQTTGKKIESLNENELNNEIYNYLYRKDFPIELFNFAAKEINAIKNPNYKEFSYTSNFINHKVNYNKYL